MEESKMELKDISDYLGIEADNMDDFKEKFNAQYFTEAQVFADKSKLNLFTGKTLGSVTLNATKIAKGFGVELTKDEVKDKSVEDVLNLSFEKMTDAHNSSLDKVKSENKATKDERLDALKVDYEKSLTKITDLETLNKHTADKLVDAEKDFTGKMLEFKKGYLKKDIYNGIKYAPDLDPLKKTGFIATMDQKYNFDFDENGDAFITKDGNRIENPKKHGTFLSPSEVLEQEAKEANVVALNKKAGEPFSPPKTPQATEPPKRRLHPNAIG